MSVYHSTQPHKRGTQHNTRELW